MGYSVRVRRRLRHGGVQQQHPGVSLGFGFGFGFGFGLMLGSGTQLRCGSVAYSLVARSAW